MNEAIEEFIRQITALSPAIATVYEKTIQHWHPEAPPLIMPFIDIGTSIVDEFERNDAKTNGAVFDVIESGMASDDEELRAVIATGLPKEGGTQFVPGSGSRLDCTRTNG